MEKKGDHHLVAQVLEGNRFAYAKLVAQYRDMVFTLALKILKNREEAEEVAQDVFIKVYQSLNRFQGKSKLSTWVYRIAYNHSLNQLKANQKNRNTGTLENIQPINGNYEPDAFEMIQKTENSQTLQNALGLLPETDQIIVTLYYYEELPVKEIAEIVGLSVQNVKVKLHRSRQKLYETLKDKITA
ncbi:MAG: RNA polymerase sigma factor [Bacteroidales bacterium]|nr:RNA polymerase sigma factor [Bacteroidales bacterium]